jgi:hypothetical protein
MLVMNAYEAIILIISLAALGAFFLCLGTVIE